MSHQKLIMAVLLAAASGNSLASGFALSGKSASSLGNGLSGTAVSAEDASVIYGNPAAMRDLEGEHFSALLHLINTDVKFDNKGSTSNGSPTTGDAHEHVNKNHIIPNFYYLKTLNEDLTFGFGIYTPFGLSLEYDDNWVGRYHSTESSLRTINFSPAIAFSPSDKLNLGFGVDFQYFSSELNKEIDFGRICEVYEARGYIPVGTCSSPGVELVAQQDDGSNTLTGDNWAMGYSLGMTYDLNEATRLGASFHSSTRHDVEGNAQFSGVPDIFAGTFHNSDASLTLMLPETLSLGVRQVVTPRLEVMADYTWTRWSRYDELLVKFTNGLTPAVEENNWKDSSRFAVGMNYRLQDDWLLRSGITYDQTPVPDAEHRSPRVPDEDKLSLGLGSNVGLNDSMDLDFALFYTLPTSTDINNTDSLGHTLKGSYETQTTYLSMQFNWKIQ